MVRLASLVLGLLPVAGVLAGPVPQQQQQQHQQEEGNMTVSFRQNDWSCRSHSHPNPVVLLHGLFASEQIDLNFLENWLRDRGFCTFALTYGSYAPQLPLLGGVKPIAESSLEVAAFIREVHQKTGAAKVDLVGHSEGGFQSLYVAKFHAVASIVDHIVAIAPPTHGTNLAGLYNLAYLFGLASRDAIAKLIDTVGCGACNDMVTAGPAVTRLNDGQPIVQPGNTVTIITSRLDEVVTPSTAAFVDEPGVNNIHVQDSCLLDPVGHVFQAIDLNVWNLVLNALENRTGRWFFCLLAPPGR